MTAPYKQCPRCQTPAHLTAAQCYQCGHQYRTRFVPAPDQTQAFGLDAPSVSPVPQMQTAAGYRLVPMIQEDTARPFLIALMWILALMCGILLRTNRQIALLLDAGAMLLALILTVSRSRADRCSGWIMLVVQCVIGAVYFSGGFKF